MARKAQENPALDMTPMIDVVFELIIFFVVTLTEAERKEEYRRQKQAPFFDMFQFDHPFFFENKTTNPTLLMVKYYHPASDKSTFNALYSKHRAQFINIQH